MSILITGASRGLGRALYDLYAAAGRAVIGTARRPSEDGWHALDVSDAESITALGARLEGQPIDLLICNAGIFPDKAETLGAGFPPAMWEEVFRTNVTGTFLTIQALLPNLRLSEAPKIALLASRLGSSEQAEGGRYIYRASKAAMINMGRNLSIDLAPEGIAVGIYHPGWVRTDMGGPDGAIDVDTSVRGLAARFDELGLETSGKFRAFDGESLPY